MGIETTKKLAYLAETKDLIKAALIEKGQAVSDTDTFRSYAGKVLAIETGGGSGGGGALGTGDYLVQVVDYDGTVLSIGYMNKGDVFTLPDAPTHEGLVFDGWSSPVTITNNTVTVENQDITIGPMYHTESGATEVDIVLTAQTGLVFSFRSDGVTGMTSVDWGDGTTDSTLTHTYLGYGKYTIKIYGATKLNGGSYSGNISNVGVNKTIVAVRLASSVTILGKHAFNSCRTLQTISIPNTVTSFDEGPFFTCGRLKSLTIPTGVTSIPNNMCRECYRLTNVVVPSSVTSFGEYAFAFCYCLTSISIPSGVTALGSYVTRGCSIASVTIPKGVTSFPMAGFMENENIRRISVLCPVSTVPDSAFKSCYCAETYDFTACVAVPNLEYTSAFSGIETTCQILVPATLYDEWIAATNWTTYKTYIVAV